MSVDAVPMQDHFHAPLSVRRHWHAFHNAWATYLASDLNARLPEGYFAESNVQFGIEIDVAAFEEPDGAAANARDAGDDAAAALVAPWSPPEPVASIPFDPTGETVEVLVYDHREGPALAGAIELVSPANKDRPAHRAAFVAKCETYLQRGAGLVVVDLVTNRQANLHNELLARLSPAAARSADALYATAYHPTQRDDQAALDLWHYPLAVGQPLPTLPLWLRGPLCVPADLSGTYSRTCREQRIVRSAVTGGRPARPT